MRRPRGRVRARAVACLAGALTLVCCAEALAQPKTVVLIGGPDSEGPGYHDHPDVVRRIADLLATSPDTREAVRVVVYPDGWPQESTALDEADTLVWVFDGLDRHPLHDAARHRAFERAMARGVGLVALHQASTVPSTDSFALRDALGAVRVGTFDRTTEWTTLTPATPTHVVLRGVGAFELRDEFYPTLQMSPIGTVTPLLEATLHPQYRDGAPVLALAGETANPAWAYERPDGGRSVGYVGGHFTQVFDAPGVRRFLRNAVLWTAGAQVPALGAAGEDAPLPIASEASSIPSITVPRFATFHADPSRSGWHRDQAALVRAVRTREFGQVWASPALADFDDRPPRLYASPLHAPQLAITGGPERGRVLDAVIAATSNGDVYAINTRRAGDLAPGRILWHTRLADPCLFEPAPLDGVPTGILSTPVIDRERNRLYVTHCDPVARWQAYALDLGSGAVLPGWPVRLDEDAFNRLNRNAGPQRLPQRRRFDFRVQRGALNLSPDGRALYITFGESETGWLVAVDTDAARLQSAFATVAMPHRGSGGLWGAGGPAVDAEGAIYVVTGSGYDGYRDAPHDWTQSVLKLALDDEGRFALRGTYTPFNHCSSAKHDIDLGSGGAILLPPMDTSTAARLLAFGGKQGNAYLLDSERLPGALDRRPPCSDDASSDASLLAPTVQPQFGTRGPLNVFGPYSEEDAALDTARGRSVPAAFRDADGADLLYVTGNTRRAPGAAEAIPPSIARLRVMRGSDASPYLVRDRINADLVLGNPGSPVVTSAGSRDAVVWVLDENAPRSALLAGDDAPRPVLYALDGASLDVLWRSAPGELATSGKYNAPAFGDGLVLVGTDRIQAFGAGGSRSSMLPDRASTTAQTVRSDPRTAAAKTDAHVPDAAAASASTDGATLYAQRCAMCHDHAQGNIPPRTVIATRSRERIVDALMHGVMRPHAAGLTAEQIGRLADYLQ